MQQVAAEMHLSETAFAHPLAASADADWALRWFTPEVETNLCGHATLATAHAMHRDRGTAGTVRFMSRSGVLVAHTADDGTITLDFPAARRPRSPRPGASRRRSARPRRRPTRPAPSATCWASSRTRPAVRALAPDLAAIADIARRDGIRGTIATASAPTRNGAMTSSRASSPPPTASPRIP